jgi:uncharacterized protein with GYD domain
MPHFMFRGRYAPLSLTAMVSNPQDREAAARTLVESLGGKLDCFFFAFGREDFVSIIEAPDDVAMAAMALAVSASGGFSEVSTTKLMTSREAMHAMEAAQDVVAVYDPPSMLHLNLGYAL